jgi:hypothetical protein
MRQGGDVGTHTARRFMRSATGNLSSRTIEGRLSARPRGVRPWRSDHDRSRPAAPVLPCRGISPAYLRRIPTATAASADGIACPAGLAPRPAPRLIVYSLPAPCLARDPQRISLRLARGHSRLRLLGRVLARDARRCAGRILVTSATRSGPGPAGRLAREDCRGAGIAFVEVLVPFLLIRMALPSSEMPTNRPCDFA